MALQKRSGAIPVTTEKDHVRIGTPTRGALKTLAEAMVGLPVTLAFDEPGARALQALLDGALNKR